MVDSFGRIMMYFFLLVFFNVYGDLIFMDIMVLEFELEFYFVFEFIKK